MNSNTKTDLIKEIDNIFTSIDAQNDLVHEKKMIMYRFLSEIERISEEKELNRKDLAALIGTSASYITQLYRGNKVINLETIAKFQKALDFQFEIKAIPNKAEEVYTSINMENIYENQNQIEGFWAFHKFKPSYNSVLEDNIISYNEPKQMTA